MNPKESLSHLMRGRDWSTIDELLVAADDAGIWSEDFLRDAVAQAKKHQLRAMIKRVRDETGFPIVASTVTKNEDGEEVRIYKSEFLFNLNDYLQVAEYWRERSIYAIHMANGYVARANQRFNKQLNLPFPGIADAA